MSVVFLPVKKPLGLRPRTYLIIPGIHYFASPEPESSKWFYFTGKWFFLPVGSSAPRSGARKLRNPLGFLVILCIPGLIGSPDPGLDRLKKQLWLRPRLIYCFEKSDILPPGSPNPASGFFLPLSCFLPVKKPRSYV